MLHELQGPLRSLGSALVFSLLGVLLFVLAFAVMRKVLPFNLIKELEEDQNIAVGILLGSIMIGISLIVAAAIH
jgi:uncharacterized membrane protein YjfL (UPF0719 family)